MRRPRRARGSAKMRDAYAFLAEVEQQKRVFTRDDLIQASGWTEQTTKANLSKKLTQIIQPVTGGYSCTGAIDLGEDGFFRICSQNSALAGDPRRPLLTARVDELVQKAKESTLAAVQHYNNPTAIFRSGNYIVLMIIGYTALFHAIFEREGVDYIERRADGTPKLTADNKAYHWDAQRCARYYAQRNADRYEKGMLTAMAKNVEFIFPMRHEIEHRHLPQLDLDIAGHCQSMLLNFERILVKEFTRYHALNPSLSLALQFSTERPLETINSVRRLQSAEYASLREYISKYHANLPDEISGSLAFEFRVFLIQKPAVRERGSDLSIEFVRTDQLTEEERVKFQESIVAVKAVLGDPSKECNLWEHEVVSRLIEILGPTIKFGPTDRKITNTMVRWVRDHHKIANPSVMYYRPGKNESRPYYGTAFIDWIVKGYREDADFFYTSRPTE